MRSTDCQNGHFFRSNFAVFKLSLTALAVLCALSFAASTADANERVQLSAFIVKAENARRKRLVTIPITVIVEVATKKRAQYVCAVAPRIRDAMLRDLPRIKFSIDRRGNFLAPGATQRAKATVNKALRWNIVEQIHIRQGTPKVSSASAANFARSGCIQLVPERLRNRAQRAKDAKSRSEHADRGRSVSR